MTTFDWSITKMTVAPMEEGQTDVVVSADWKCTAIASNGAAVAYGTCTFTYTGGEFTPYSQLTQEQVLDWIFGLPDFDKSKQEEDLQVNIDTRSSRTKLTPPLPWQSPQE